MGLPKNNQPYPRICMLIPSFYPLIGGAERQVMGLCREMRRKGIETFVLTRRIEGTPEKEIINGTKVIRLSGRWYPLMFLMALLIHLFFNRNCYDIIHVHTLNSPALIAALIGFLCRKRVVIKVTRSGKNSQIESYQLCWWKRLIFKIMYREIACFIAITADVRKELLKLGVPKKKIALIPNGVAIPKMSNEITEDHQSELDEKIICLSVGRLIKRKRFDLLLNAWAEQKNINDATLIIIGDGPERNRLEKMASNLMVSDSIHFFGSVIHDKVLYWLKQAHCFILPSDSEGMSNALLEAMAYGLPVIVSNIHANYSLIQDGINGFLFSNLNDLTEKLQLLIQDRDCRLRLGQKAREYIEKYHSFSQVALLNLRLYEKINNKK